jgi:toxin ParE1/3/4
MEVSLTADQRAFVRQAIASGRLRDEEEAVQEALALWEERERRRLELISSIGAATAAHERGEGKPISAHSMRELANDVKARGRQRLAAEQRHRDWVPHRVAPEAEVDLDDIWYFIATESGNPDIADRFVDALTERFVLLGENPHMGRRRDEDLLPGVRSFPVGRYVIIYRALPNGDVLIVRVIPGERDIPPLLR